MLALTVSILIGERKRVRVRARVPRWSKIAVPAAALLLIFARPAFGAATGLNLYREGKYNDAYKSFQEDLQSHPDSSQKDKIEFDAGAAAFKMGDYNKALQSFSNALLSSDKGLQENSHFNLGRTLEDRADMDQTNETTLKDLTDAASHYESTLRLNPKNEAAKANLEEVKKKIERLKRHPKQKPTPPPQQQNKKDKNQQQSGGGEQNQDQQQSQSQGNAGKDQSQQQQQQQQQAQSQNQSGSSKNSQDKSNQAQAKNEPQKSQQPQAGETPSPSPGKDQQQANQPSPPPGKGENKNAGATPSPSVGEQDRQSGRDQEQPEESPSPSGGDDQKPSPSPGEGDEGGENATPSATPTSSPQKKLAGEIKGANGDQQPQNPQNAAQLAEAEPEKEGQMSEKQAELLLKSMKDEEQRVLLDERKVRRHVYNDW